MKTLYSLLLFLAIVIGSFNQGSAQVTLTLPADIPAAPGNAVTVPVNAKGINNMVGFQFTIEYEKTKLNFVNISNWATGITGVTASTPEEGKITFVYADPNLKINIADGKFFDINFSVKDGTSGSANLAWSDNPTAKSLINYDLEEINCNYIDGSVKIRSSCDAPSAPVVGTISNNSVVLNGLPTTGEWTITRTPGNTNYTGTGTSFTVTQLNVGSYNFTVTNSSGCTSPVSATAVIGSQSAILTIGAADTFSGSNMSVTVSAKGISDMVGFQFTIEYEKTKLSFVNISNWATGITGVTVSTPEEGKITFVYADPNFKINIVEGKFFDINFKMKDGTSGSANLNWSDNPTAKSLINYDLEEIGCMYESLSTNLKVIMGSNIQIYPNPFGNYVMFENHELVSRMRITNVKGQTVIESEDPKHFINTEELIDGVYFITLLGKDDVLKSVKMIKISR
jgi:hypothetical protein